MVKPKLRNMKQLIPGGRSRVRIHTLTPKSAIVTVTFGRRVEIVWGFPLDTAFTCVVSLNFHYCPESRRQDGCLTNEETEAREGSGLSGVIRGAGILDEVCLSALSRCLESQ